MSTGEAPVDLVGDPTTLDAVVEGAVRRALAEDLGPRGDVSGQLIDPEARGRLAIVGRVAGVVAGQACATFAFHLVDPTLTVDWRIGDGRPVEPGDCVATIEGNFRSILAAERTALNFLCHLSGVATCTRRFVAAVEAANPATVVLDTRKTTPGLRLLEKRAVRAGGGHNHRLGLSDALLIKDNHLGALSITEAVTRARAMWPELTCEVECDRLDQAIEAVGAGAQAVLLDNMDPDQVAACVAAIRALQSQPVRIEVSGGVTLASAPLLAAAGADCISVGALTHSAGVLDFGLDLVQEG